MVNDIVIVNEQRDLTNKSDSLRTEWQKDTGEASISITSVASYH